MQWGKKKQMQKGFSLGCWSWLSRKHHCHRTQVSRAVEEHVAEDQAPQTEKKLQAEHPQPHSGASSPHA